jgi:MOSC domain-containing protein YiiM
MTVVSVHVGMPRSEMRRDGKLYTGAAKASVSSAMLRLDGFDGDGVADRRHHGGRDRTVCVFPSLHYEWWRTVKGIDLEFGAFAENLTVDDIEEGDICIGDIVRIGAALAQVTLPRDPCRTLDRITEVPSLHLVARESGRCGFHMRTLEEGLVWRGDTFELMERTPANVTVSAVLDLYHGRSNDRALLLKLQSMPEFAEEGKRELARRLG